MRADIRISLPLKNFWLGCSRIMWIRLCALWGPEGKTGMTLLPALGNNCCVDKERQGCLLILTVSSERACWLLQHILWKSQCSSISGNFQKRFVPWFVTSHPAQRSSGLGCSSRPAASGDTLSRMTTIDPHEEHWYEKLYFNTPNRCVNKSCSEVSHTFRYLAQIFTVIHQSSDEHKPSH